LAAITGSAFFISQKNKNQCTFKNPVVVDPYADPDLAFYLNVKPNPGSQINADLCGFGSWPDFQVTKAAFLHEKYI
jgi:hypothetical protein